MCVPYSFTTNDARLAELRNHHYLHGTIITELCHWILIAVQHLLTSWRTYMVRSIMACVLTLQYSGCHHNSGNTGLSTAGDGAVTESTWWYWYLANTTAPVRRSSTAVSTNHSNFDYNWSVLHIVRTMHLKIPLSVWSQSTSLSWLPSFFLPVTILNPINRTMVFGDWLELVHPLGGTYYYNTNKVSTACRKSCTHFIQIRMRTHWRTWGGFNI
jgi:hypothetical protein